MRRGKWWIEGRTKSSNQQEEVPIENRLQGRVLGLDVGDRRIGVAVSDELGLTAQPVLTLVRKNRRQDLAPWPGWCASMAVPRWWWATRCTCRATSAPRRSRRRPLPRPLQLETGATVTLWDERLSTTEAHRHLDAAGRLPGDRRAVIDQVAAVLILQSFLDSRRS